MSFNAWKEEVISELFSLRWKPKDVFYAIKADGTIASSWADGMSPSSYVAKLRRFTPHYVVERILQKAS